MWGFNKLVIKPASSILIFLREITTWKTTNKLHRVIRHCRQLTILTTYIFSARNSCLPSLVYICIHILPCHRPRIHRRSDTACLRTPLARNIYESELYIQRQKKTLFQR